MWAPKDSITQKVNKIEHVKGMCRAVSPSNRCAMQCNGYWNIKHRECNKKYKRQRFERDTNLGTANKEKKEEELKESITKTTQNIIKRNKLKNYKAQL